SYADDGVRVTEVTTERQLGQRTRLVRDAAAENRWVEEQLTAGTDGRQSWQRTANAYNMSVELVGQDSPLRLSNRPLPPGSIVMTQLQNNRPTTRRIITPQGTEIIGRATDGGNETMPLQIFETPRPAQGQPGGPTRRIQYSPSDAVPPRTNPPPPGAPQERPRTQTQDRTRVEDRTRR
ncbi:MAG: hypothetical protein K2Z81_26230, partial [Cyanobacteria bacterium]|nr:hypothetical protein [Cyanobacteriota bacterium]